MSARHPETHPARAPWADERVAPNGRRISANFRDWFARSHVVDDAGMPLVVFHGGQSDITAFRESDSGIFFAARPGAASAYAFGPEDTAHDGSTVPEGANVACVYLSIQNPLVVTDEWLEEFAKRAPPDPYRRGHSFRDDFVDSEIYAREAVTAEAKRLGYDGMVLPADFLPIEHMCGDWDEQPAYVAFRPEQIKSAIGNNGNYDPASASLTDAPSAPRLRLNQPGF